MAIPVHVKGQPIEPCPHIDAGTCFGHTVTLNTVRRIFLISSFIFMTALLVWGYLQGINAYSLPWKIVTPIISNLAAFTAFFSYIILAKAYNIAPPGFYKVFPASK